MGGLRGLAGQAQMSAPAPEAAPGPRLSSFEDVAVLAEARRDIALKYDIERYVRPISFRLGAVEFEPAPGAPSNLAQRISARLKEWTGETWLVATEGRGGAETVTDRVTRARAETLEAARTEPFVQAVMAAFPGTEIVEVRQMEAPATPATDPEAPDEDD